MENLEKLLQFCEHEYGQVPIMQRMLLHARLEFDTLRRKYHVEAVEQIEARKAAVAAAAKVKTA